MRSAPLLSLLCAGCVALAGIEEGIPRPAGAGGSGGQGGAGQAGSGQGGAAGPGGAGQAGSPSAGSSDPGGAGGDTAGAGGEGGAGGDPAGAGGEAGEAAGSGGVQGGQGGAGQAGAGQGGTGAGGAGQGGSEAAGASGEAGQAGAAGVWVRRYGSAEDETLEFAASDGAGGVYVLGRMGGALDVGGVELTAQTQEAIYLARVDPAGKTLWAVAMGAAELLPMGLSSASDGGVYVLAAGNGGLKFIGQPGAPDAGGPKGTFVVRMSQGGVPLWAKHFGGPDASISLRSVVEKDGALMAAGSFTGTLALGTTTLTSAGSPGILKSDALLMSLSAASGEGILARGFGGPGSDRILSAIPAAAGFQVVGACAGEIQPPGLPPQPCSEMFWGELDGSLNFTGFKAYAVQSPSELRMAPGLGGKSFVAGYYQGTATLDVELPASKAKRQAFIARLASDGVPLGSQTLSLPDKTAPSSLLPVEGGGVRVAGGFQGKLKGPSGLVESTPPGEQNGFVLTLSPSFEPVSLLHLPGSGLGVKQQVTWLAAGEGGAYYATASMSHAFSVQGASYEALGIQDGFLLRIP